MSQASPMTRRALLSLRLGNGEAPGRADAAGPLDDPFASYEAAYAQVNEARPFLAEEAHRLGIDTRNRNDFDILTEIFAKADLPSA